MTLESVDADTLAFDWEQNVLGLDSWDEVGDLFGSYAYGGTLDDRSKAIDTIIRRKLGEM
jgi:hypothetical protein